MVKADTLLSDKEYVAFLSLRWVSLTICNVHASMKKQFSIIYVH